MTLTATKKYSYIDSLRGYAVFMVLCTHIFAFIANSDHRVPLSNFWVQCRFGVMLFFIISALTLFLSFEQKIKSEISPIKNFFIRRVFRIAPLFYLLFLVNIFFKQFSLINIISTLTFTNGFIPDVMMKEIVSNGWTIAVEMLFYILVPLLFTIIKNINHALISLIICFLISIIAKYLMFKYGAYPHITIVGYTYYWLPAQLPVFALGIVLYFVIFKSDLIVNSEHQFKKQLGYFMIFCGVYFFIALSFSNKLFITENIAFSFALILLIFGMAIYPINIFNNKWSQFLGRVSYSFYLIHGIIIGFVGPTIAKTFQSNNLRFVTGVFSVLVIATILSYISYKLIEQPFQKLGSKLIAKMEHKRSVGKDDIVIL